MYEELGANKPRSSHSSAIATASSKPTVEVRVRLVGDEELGAVCVGPAVGHGHNAALRMNTAKAKVEDAVGGTAVEVLERERVNNNSWGEACPLQHALRALMRQKHFGQQAVVRHSQPSLRHARSWTCIAAPRSRNQRGAARAGAGAHWRRLQAAARRLCQKAGPGGCVRWLCRRLQPAAKAVQLLTLLCLRWSAISSGNLPFGVW